MKPTIDLIAGARPNFMKLAPVLRAIRAANRLEARVIHTGQHYDPLMNDVFFEELGIPAPDVHLGVGSGPHGAQTARILERYEAHLLGLERKPSATVVFGDVNSTVAAALAAVKLGVKVVHVEAGLRSFDRTMPEEINRILTDAIADLLLVSEPSGVRNLEREGVAADKIKLVGNVMIDTLVHELAHAKRSDLLTRLELEPQSYGYITMHRPSNVDDPAILATLMATFADLSQSLPLVFPVHPRTRAALERAGANDATSRANGLRLIDPLPYRESLALLANARLVLTDSGGIQEETTFLHVPCLTMRENTERPITTEIGTSRLVGNDPTRIRTAFAAALAGHWPTGEVVPWWDGAAADRVAIELARWLKDPVGD